MGKHVTKAGVVVTVIGGALIASASAATPVPPVDTSNRASVVALHRSVHSTTVSDAGWTGSLDTCTPGTLDLAYREQAYTEVNYYRAMAGVPSSVTENETYRSQAQAAAIIWPLSASGTDPHNPPPSSPCYSAEGAEGAASSNFFGQFGTPMNGRAVVQGWMDDGLSSMGHRYGILHPPAMKSGYGDVPTAGATWGAQYLYVFDETFTPWPAMNTPGGALLWPPAGFVPYQDVFRAWSFFLSGAEVDNAVVTMTKDGVPIASPIIFRATRQAGFYPASALVWQPDMPLEGSNHAKPAADVTYQVTITGMPGRDPLVYAVKVISPDAASCGDVNGDGRVTLADAVIIQRSLLVPSSATMAFPDRCDVNASQSCSLADALVIRRSLLTPPTATIQEACAPAVPQ